MALQTISGTVASVTGVAQAGQVLKIIPALRVATDGADLVLGDTFTVTADGWGDVSFQVEPGSYVIEAAMSAGLFRTAMSVGTDGPYDFGDVINAVPPEFGASIVAQAAESAELAEAWAESDTAPDGGDTGSAKSWATTAEDTEVAGGEYSAKHYAAKSATSAGTASTHAGTATTQAGIATTQAGIATTQAGIATTKADEAAASADDSEDSATSAEADRVLAQAAAVAAAADATTYPSVAAGEAATSDGDVFLVPSVGGVKIYSNDSGTGVFAGWLTRPKFDTVAAMLSSTDTAYSDGDQVEAGEYSYTVDSVDGILTTAGSVKLTPNRCADGAYHTLSIGTPSGTNDTTLIAALLALAANGTLVFDYHVSGWDAGGLIPGDNTTIKLMPGTVLRGVAAGARVFQIQRENVTLEGFGATIQRHVSQTSHVVYINASTTNWGKRVRVRGLKIIGNGSLGTGGTGENDCIYIGGSPQGVGGDPASEAIPEDVIIEDCHLISPRRNVISVVAGSNIHIRDNIIDGTDAVVLKCGVDVEANKYMADGSVPVDNIHIYRNKFINCGSWGVVSVFGGTTNVYENEFHMTGTAKAIGTGAGGAQYNTGVYRDGDILGAGAFDTGTGNITVRGGGDATLHDLGIHVGMWVQGQVEFGSGAAFPAELTSPYRYAISWISADGTQFRVSSYYLHNEKTSFSGSGTGTLDTDPEVSNLTFLVFRPGPSGKIIARNNTIFGNTSLSLIDISTFYETTVENNTIIQEGTGTCISAAYGYKPRFIGNTMTGGIRGINAGSVTLPYSEGNTVRLTTLDGITFGGSGACSVNDFVDRPTGDGLDFGNGAEQRIIGATVYNDDETTSATGIKMNSANGLVSGCNARGAGSTLASSISATGSGARVVDSIRKDGTWYP